MDLEEKRKEVLIIEDEPEPIQEVLDYLSSLNCNIELCPSGMLAIERCKEKIFDIAFIDYNLPIMNGVETGKEIKKHQHDIVLFILSVFDNDEYIIDAIDSDFDDYLLKEPFSEALLKIALIKAERIIKNKSKYRTASCLVHSKLELIPYVNELIGIGDFLKEIGRTVQPFFDWMSHKIEKRPEQLKSKFDGGILLEGDPGSGKSSISEAIANAFKSTEFILPRDLGPGMHPRSWYDEFKLHVLNIYKCALVRRVVVVRADDLVWPLPTEMGGDVGAEWLRYLNTIRECIEDASAINSGLKPSGKLALEINKEFKGKILWIFSRNTDDDANPMYRPLRDMLKSYKMHFPKLYEDRREIIYYTVNNEGFKFCNDRVFDYATSISMHYSGRDLIGHRNDGKGFLNFIIERVKVRELDREVKEDKDYNFEITKDEISEWEISHECKEINRRLTEEKSFDNISSITSLDEEGDMFYSNNEKEYGTVLSKLNLWEKICSEFYSTENKISQSKIAEKIPNSKKGDHVNREAIAIFCKKHKDLILEILKKHPHKYPYLLSKSGIKTWGQK